MKELPEIQKDFFKEHFALSKRDLPDSFAPSFYIGLILNKYPYTKGGYYEGTRLNLHHCIWEAYTQSNKNADCKKLEVQLLYIEKLCISFEYYELAYNIRIFLNAMHECRFKLLLRDFNEENIDLELAKLFFELNLYVEKQDLVEEDFDDHPF